MGRHPSLLLPARNLVKIDQPLLGTELGCLVRLVWSEEYKKLDGRLVVINVQLVVSILKIKNPTKTCWSIQQNREISITRSDMSDGWDWDPSWDAMAMAKGKFKGKGKGKGPAPRKQETLWSDRVFWYQTSGVIENKWFHILTSLSNLGIGYITLYKFSWSLKQWGNL